MSRCSEERMNRPRAEKLEDLDLVTQLIAKEFLKEFTVIYVCDSRMRGDWRYCSDFDFAVDMPNAYERKQKQDEYSNKFGVKIDLMDSEFIERLPTRGLKIERND